MASRQPAVEMKPVGETDPRKLDIKGLSARLLAYVLRRVSRYRWCGSTDALPKGMSAEGIALDAMESLFCGKNKWDSSKVPDPWLHLITVVNRAVSALSVCADNQLVPLEDHEPAVEATPETALIAAERGAWANRARDLLMDRIIEDVELIAIHDLSEKEDLEKPAVVAAALGWPVAKVYDARKRLKRHMVEIEKQLIEHLEGGAEDV